MIDIDSGTVGNQTEGDTVDADVESIAGGGGDDNLVGGTGAGSVIGNGGNDTLNGGAGHRRPTRSAAAPASTRSPTRAGSHAVTVTLDGVANDGEGGENDNVMANVENATGGGGGDTITGNDAVNHLSGGGGADTLNGGANNDVLVGGAAGDTLAGGSGTGDLADYSAEVVGADDHDRRSGERRRPRRQRHHVDRERHRRIRRRQHHRDRTRRTS